MIPYNPEIFEMATTKPTTRGTGENEWVTFGVRRALAAFVTETWLGEGE
jgi:hypothetical protein